MKIYRIAKLNDFLKNVPLEEVTLKVKDFFIKMSPETKRNFFIKDNVVKMFSKNINGKDISFYLKTIENVARTKYVDNNKIEIYINPKYFMYILNPKTERRTYMLLLSTVAHELYHALEPLARQRSNLPNYHEDGSEIDAYVIEIILLSKYLAQYGLDMDKLLRGDFSEFINKISENEEVEDVFSGSSSALIEFINSLNSNVGVKKTVLSKLYKELT